MPRLGGTKTLIAFAEPSGVMKLFDIWKCPIDPTLENQVEYGE